MTATAVTRSFVTAINRGDFDALASLMTEDHVFIDSEGVEHRGREAMRASWRRYFSLVPDYRIAVHEWYGRGPVVVLIGTAQGTYAHAGRLEAGDRWSTPAAWKAVVSGDHLATWQVFADNEPMRRLMRRYENESI